MGWFKIKNLFDPSESEDNKVQDKTGWKSIIILLLFLYAIQGVPLGILGSMPLIMQSHNVTYTEQAKFSIAGWPFSLKLLWAPLVDSLFFERMGRRKSWLIPVQYLIGVTMLYLSYQVDILLESMQIGKLTMVFFILIFLTATQDVAVGGWALTLLGKENVGFTSTCNAVGQSFGFFLGYAVLLNLASPEFSNKYLRSEPQSAGVVTLSSFLFLWACIFGISTTLLLIFKSDRAQPNVSNDVKDEENQTNVILASYMRLWWITKLPAVRKFLVFLFTSTVFALNDLKLVEAGVAKETRALMSIALTPTSLLVPLLISKWTVGATPMSLYMKAYCFGLLFTGVSAVMVWVTTLVKGTNDGGFPVWYFPTLLGIESLFNVVLTIMFVTVVAFFAKISDPEHGGTSMTLYTTASNLAYSLPNAIALWLVDTLAVKSCTIDTTNSTFESLQDSKPTCTTTFDGYYTETIVCIIIGFIWFFLGNGAIKELQRRPESAWRLENAVDRTINATTIESAL